MKTFESAFLFSSFHSLHSLTFQFRYLPISSSSDPISIDLTTPMIRTSSSCTFNQSVSPSHRRNSSSSSIHLFLFIIFGSLFLLLFIGVMLAFIYGLIFKQYRRWLRKRSSRRRRKRKTTNVVGDESTVLGVETDTV